MDSEAIMLEKLPSYGSKETVIQNLEDAGCTADIVGPAGHKDAMLYEPFLF